MLTENIFLKICCDKLTLKIKNIPSKTSFSHKSCFQLLFPKMAVVRPQFSSANNFFLRPVLSYFAEFSTGWQQ
jgi:hypothetical protein